MIAERAVEQRIRVLAWLVVLAIGLWLRFWQLDIQILIDDEWHALHRLMTADYGPIFLSLGHADYSIPLTLLFKFLALTVGLEEWQMRALPMLAGCAAIVVIPRLLADWLDRDEHLLLGGLIAISPLLVHFSRYVRPYALVVLMGLAAVILLWLWWHHGGRWRALLFCVITPLCIWLHALSALFIGAALVWFGVAGLIEARRGDWRQLGRLLAVGGLATAASCALLLPPILADPWSIAAKAGIDRPDAITVIRSWELVLGTAGNPLALVGLVLAGIGAWRLWQRDHLFLLYWAWMLAVALVGLMLLEPAWIQNALVLVRYLAIAQPVMLALVAVGVVSTAHAVAGLAGRPARPAMVLSVGVAFIAAFWLAGPLPRVYSGINQFTNAVRYQVDYDFERSVFHDIMSPVKTPAVYDRMAAEPGDWEIVEAAWYFESNNTPISEYQVEHQMPIRVGMISGLCSNWTWGELKPGGPHRIDLARFVFLSELIERGPRGNRFVVFHRQRPFEHSRELPDVDPCIRAFRERFGAPWHASQARVVFRLPATGRGDGA